MALPADFGLKVINKLKERGVQSTCEICQQNNWTVIEQALAVNITDLSGSFAIPPPQVPCASLICNNCGNVRLFALGPLGLLPEPEKAKP